MIPNSGRLCKRRHVRIRCHPKSCPISFPCSHARQDVEAFVKLMKKKLKLKVLWVVCCQMRRQTRHYFGTPLCAYMPFATDGACRRSALRSTSPPTGLSPTRARGMDVESICAQLPNLILCISNFQLLALFDDGYARREHGCVWREFRCRCPLASVVCIVERTERCK